VKDLRAEAARLSGLLDADPALAVAGAREIDLACEGVERLNRMSVRAAILVDGGLAVGDRAAVIEAVSLLRELRAAVAKPTVVYNLANALSALAGHAPRDDGWLDHMETTRALRLEARSLYVAVGRDDSADVKQRTQAWTNLASLLTGTWRLGEAHDARLAALRLDPTNGVAAGAAAKDLNWLLQQPGMCGPATAVEAEHLAHIAELHRERSAEYAGAAAADHYASFRRGAEPPARRAPHVDPFVRWVEDERLTLAPTVELVEPSLGHLDWLMLPGILEREAGAPATPPPVYAMFNVLKGDFVLARDLAWRATTQAWPRTARFADTLDLARYGPASAALVLALRSALDLLDKVAVLANHYFDLGKSPAEVYFRTLWREKKPAADGSKPLRPEVANAIRGGCAALLGLVELADDYDTGWRKPQRDLRNAGTHRFVVLHDDIGERTAREAPEVERHSADAFEKEVIQALQVARSAIQVLAFATRQHEDVLRARIDGPIGSLIVPDHAWVRGEEE
jgi:hypothetical protein